MKKHYMPVLAWVACLFMILAFTSVQAQMPPFKHYNSTKLYTWTDSTKFKSLELTTVPAPNSGLLTGAMPMRFRLMKPNGFDSSPASAKYPIIVFFHGTGEAAPYDATANASSGTQDNEKQLYHGGQTHYNAVLSNKFPGFLLYPQMRRGASDNAWGPTNIEAVRAILDILITSYKVDPERIYVHGLSGGGEATYKIITAYPEYFAAAHPMSAAENQFWGGGKADLYIHLPLRASQGALDTNPTPAQGNAQVVGIRGLGGSIQYTYYPTLGHGTWNSEYAKTDFFSWFLGKRKTRITVLNEQTSFCPGTPINVTMGLTLGGNPALGLQGSVTAPASKLAIIGYQWAKNDTISGIISGATANLYTATTTGTYYARLQRTGETMSAKRWSAPVVIDALKAPSTPTPTISTNGKSTTLPGLDGSPDVILSGPSGQANYLWKKNSSKLDSTTFTYLANTPGSYTLAIKTPAGTGFEADGVTATKDRAVPQGCRSVDSNIICVTTQDGAGSPAPPTNFFASPSSSTSIIINWDDRASNEDGYELYRTTTAGVGYVLIARLAAANAASNPQAYTDINLQTNVTYYYKLRAFNCAGGSAYTSEVSAKTATDTTPPTAPVLSTGVTSRTVINISWTGATDVVGIYQYDVYQNGVLIGTTASTTTTYAATGLVAFSTYNYVVKARDAAGNVSPPSNQVTATAVNLGLYYNYYLLSGNINLVSQIPTYGTLNKSGVINNFLTTPRTRSDNYAFTYDGFLTIPTTGNYTFYLSSDDGSQLYVNNALTINWDGTHGCSERNATVNLSAGTYPIKVLYFENTGGECLTVNWKGPGISKQTIPDVYLKDSFTPPAALTAPTAFVQGTPAATYNQINLQWVDQSSNETGFEIYRAATATTTAPAASAYQVIVVAPAGTGTGTTRTTSDTGLTPLTYYWYKVRAINATSASSLVTLPSPFYIRTLAAPAAPATPTGLAATPISATQVNLSWNTVAAATGYEIQRSSNATLNFTSIATITAPTLNYSDLSLNGHSTVYYRIRALGSGGNNSAYSTPAVSATTPNRAPLAFDIVDQTIASASAIPAPPIQTITATITDPDADPITFVITGLPTGGSYTDNGYGKIIFSFNNVATNTAPGYTISVQASDGISTTSDSFVLKATANHNPVVQDVTYNGSTTTTSIIPDLTTEEGRTLTLVVKVTDSDTPGTPNSQLTAAVPPTLSLPPGLTFANTPTWVISGNNPRTWTIAFAPPLGAAGIYNNIAVTFKDNQSPTGINVQTFSLVVAPVDKSFSIALNFVHTTSTGNYESLPWNNTGSPSATPVANLKDDQSNIVRFVTFSTPVNNWNAAGSTPAMTLPVDAGAIYTKKVRESYFRNGSASTLTFSNLNPLLEYKVTVYGANSAATAPTLYGLNGLTSVAPVPLVTLNNTRNTVTLPASGTIKPTSGGVLTVPVTHTAGTYHYINALILTAVFPDPVPPIAPSDLTLIAPAYDTVKLSWVDNSINETGFQILRTTSLTNPVTWTLVTTTGANQTSYSDNGLIGRTTYYYKVVATNVYGSTETAIKSITTPNGAPKITNPGTITVRAAQVLQQNISAIDPEGDAITLSVLNLPSFATLVDNGNGTGFIRFAPALADVEQYTLTIRATDNLSASSQLNVTLLVLDPEVDEAVYVNFVGTGGTSLASGPWYNNKKTTDGNSLLNSFGEASLITLSPSGVATWSSSSDNGGINTSSNSGIYPDKVIQSYWATTKTDNTTFITIGGLDNSKRYNLSILGSRSEFWFSNAIYSITTGTVPAPTSKTLNTSKNKSKIVRFTGVQPSGSQIVITINKGANVNTTPLVVQKDAVINGLVIESYNPAILPSPRRPSNLVAGGISKTTIRLNWFDNSSNESGFEIWRATDQQGPFTLLTTVGPNIETYDNTSLPNNKAYIYRVRAAGSTPSSFTSDAMATTFNQVVLVNVNSSSGAGHLQASAPWNNLATPPSAPLVFNNFKNDAGAATLIDLSIDTWGSGGSNNTGYVTGTNSGVYPDAVLQNYYYFEQFDTPTQYRLKGLDKNSYYDLVFLGNEWTAATINGVINATDYSAGSSTVSQFNGRNSSETVSIIGIQPDQDSVISIQIKANDEARYGIWNSLEIRSYTPLSASFDTEAPSIPQNLVASNITDVGFTLKWSPSTDNISVAGYEVFQGSTLVATVADTTAAITNLQPLTTYNFSVRAFDIKGNRSGFSNSLQVVTMPSSTAATNYYPNAIVDITQPAAWGINLDGSGANPPNFITPNQQFNVSRNASIDLPWVISGSNAKLVVNSGMQLDINAALTAPVDVIGTGKVIVNTATPPQFGTLSPTSTIDFSANPNSIPGANYGNLTLSGSSSTKSFSTGAYLVNGNLSIDNGVSLNGSTGNSTTLSISGNLTLLGSANMPVDNQLFTVDFNSGSTQTLTAKELNMKFFQLRVSNNSQLSIVNTGTLPNTLTLGGSQAGGGLLLESGSVLDLGQNALVIEGQGAINPNVTTQLGQLKVAPKADITVRSTGTQISNLYFVPGFDILNAIHLDASASSQVNLNSITYIQDQVDINNGRLNSAGNLVLLSDVNGTARIASIHNAGAILGNIEYQRYLDVKGRVYRYWSTPVFGTKVIDWINSGLTITGSFTGIAAQNPSVYYYDEINGDQGNNYYVPFPTSSNQEVFNVGRGYSVFQFKTSAPGKLKLTGPTQQGNFAFSNIASNPTDSDVTGWNLLGNPYASPIKWGDPNWQTAGIDGTVYIRTNPAGTFKVWNGSVGSGDFKGVISQGQAFWVHSNSGAGQPTIQINEDVKYDTLKAPFYRTQVARNHFMLTLSSGTLSDNAFVHFTPEGTNGIDPQVDALKLMATQFNLYTQSSNKALAINSLPEEFCESNILLGISKATAGSYQLSITDLTTFDYGVAVRLIDHFTGNEETMSEGSVYNFSISADPASSGDSRFELVVGKPVIRQDVTATLQSSSLCEGSGGVKINLINTQAGATYKIIGQGTELTTFMGNGGDFEATISENAFQYGSNTLQLMAGFSGCDAIELPAQLELTYSPTYQADATVNAICEGETAKVSVNGAPTGAIYKWYNNNTDTESIVSTESTTFDTPVLANTTHYFVSVLFNGCERTERTEVVVQVDKLIMPLVTVEGEQLISSSKKGNQWNLNQSPIEGASDITYLPKSTGVYSVTVVDGACEKTSQPVEFVITSLEQSSNEQLTLHPNPVKDRVVLLLPSEVALNSNANIYIYNASGILVAKFTKQNKKDGIGINAEDLSAGLYLMILEINGKIVQKRFIKE